MTINRTATQSDFVHTSSTEPIEFTAVFSEPVFNFVTGDVEIGGTANRDGAIAIVSAVSSTIYNVSVIGTTGNGTVVATIASGKANDNFGNTNLASSSVDNVVTRLFIVQLNEQLDSDRDGVSDETEIFVGTDPNDSRDYLHVQSLMVTRDSLTLQWRGVATRAYEIEYSNDLRRDTWKVIGLSKTETAGTVNFIDSLWRDRAQREQGYYRIRVIDARP